MRVYLAAAYRHKPYIKQLKDELKDCGIWCTSEWLDQDVNALDLKQNNGLGPAPSVYAMRDLKDIDMADVVVMFTEINRNSYLTGGKHVEFGYALGTGKEVCIVGPEENVFNHMERVRKFATWEDCKAWLKTL